MSPDTVILLPDIISVLPDIITLPHIVSMLPDIDVVTPMNHALEGILISRTTDGDVGDGLVPLPPCAVRGIWLYHLVDGGKLKALPRSILFYLQRVLYYNRNAP
jgi:hypothetical protein